MHLKTFYNLNAGGDIFNHANVHFWDYTQPGYDALGLISCTGTNFLVRARAFHQVRPHPACTQGTGPRPSTAACRGKRRGRCSGQLSMVCLTASLCCLALCRRAGSPSGP